MEAQVQLQQSVNVELRLNIKRKYLRMCNPQQLIQ